MAFIRIATDPGQMGSVPCIRGLRITVATVVARGRGRLARGQVLH
jgi:uncharacterized protein (DUF433 family)